LFEAFEGSRAVADLLSDIRRDIDRRLDQLRPVLDEFRRLEQARDALEDSAGQPRPRRASRAKGAPASSSSPQSGRTRMSRAESQEIDRGVLALLEADSDQSAVALALLTETSPGSMTSRLNRLVRDGHLKKRRRGRAVRYEVQQGKDATAK
jgi:hypothetical protein